MTNADIARYYWDLGDEGVIVYARSPLDSRRRTMRLIGEVYKTKLPLGNFSWMPHFNMGYVVFQNHWD